MEKQVKSKQRVADHGEVYTAEREVNAMLDLVKQETEREFIKQRQAEGIAAAKLRGVHLGRKPMERPDTFCTVYDEWVKGEISARTAAKRLSISHPTFLRWSKEVGNDGTLCVPPSGSLDCST